MQTFALVLFQTDTTQQQQQIANMMAGLGGGIFFLLFLLVIVFLAILIVPVWRILTKFGLAGALSLLILIPWLGPLILLYIVAFSDWRIVTLPPLNSTPAYPPAVYPPDAPLQQQYPGNYPPNNPPGY